MLKFYTNALLGAKGDITALNVLACASRCNNITQRDYDALLALFRLNVLSPESCYWEGLK